MSKNQTHISNRKVNIFLKNLNINKNASKDEYNINDFNELLKDQLNELELNTVFDMESTNFDIITNPLVNIYNYIKDILTKEYKIISTIYVEKKKKEVIKKKKKTCYLYY